VRRLIVNADDLGFTSGVNRAIVKAHTDGVVTSATLMANGPAFCEVKELPKQLPKLSIGCHVVLIDGEPVLAPARLPSLTQSGRFRDDLKTFAARALTGQHDATEITAEVAAQIRRVQAAGVCVSHLDTHKHTHIFPKVLRPLLLAAAECGVRAVRNPFGPRLPLPLGELLKQPNLWTRWAEMRVLGTFAGKFHKALQREGFVTPDGTLGIEINVALNETLFTAIATSVPEGTWEFVCHPGYNDSDLQSMKTRLRESRELELRVLTLPRAREILTQQGVELISYRDLLERRRVTT
jgi:hopanoid biosynthesis associated protein HpnK